MSAGTDDVGAGDDMAARSAIRPRRRGWRLIAGLLLAIVAIGTAALLLLDTAPGHRLIADRIAALRPGNGITYRIGRIDGSIYGRARLIDVRIYDPKGLVLRVSRADLDWNPFAWTRNRLEIRSLVAPQALLVRLPEPRATGRQGPILPGFDIGIGVLRIDRLVFGLRIGGVQRTGRLAGRADIRSGRALVRLDLDVAGSDVVRLMLDAEPDRDRFDLDLAARGGARGVLAGLTGISRPLMLRIAGDGRWRGWQGRAIARAGDLSLADLRLTNRAGDYRLVGTANPSPLLKGKLQRLTAPALRIDAGATLARRRLDGRLSVRSGALRLDATGIVDLGQAAFRNLRLTATLLRSRALFPNMTGRAIELRTVIDGPFRTASFDYRITAERLAFDRTGFERVRAGGRGRFSPAPVTVPLRFTAARVTGVGNVTGGILRNLNVEGPLQVTARSVTGSRLRLRSDKIDGRINLILDLRTGAYEVGIDGAINRLLIPGLGVVEVQSRLTVVPAPNDRRRARLVGMGTARVVRLDNAFFRSLTRGLPGVVTGLERGPDGILYLRNLRLTSPGLTLAGNGYRRRDGSFHIEATGNQVQYGPVTLLLDGRIERPTLRLRFARPNQAMGLRDVIADLDPTPEGYVFQARGISRLGAFTGNGAILLPRGGTAMVEIARLDVSGTRASGRLAIVPGGFDGAIGFAGGGWSGDLRLVPEDGMQRIGGEVRAADARLADVVTIGRGDGRFSLLLDPAGARLDARWRAAALQQGALSLASVSGTAQLTGGVGTLKATLAGSRNRNFRIEVDADLSPDLYTVRAQGMVDRRRIALTDPAVIRRDGDGWRLAPTTLAFASGEARLSGRIGAGENAIDAMLRRMPMAVLDLAYPGLGLGGEASGTLSYVHRPGGAPSGRADLKVRGLSRSGLVLSSQPVDVAIAAALTPGSAALRAIVASGGRTVGRAQLRIAPLGDGTLARRLLDAPLFAQLRYDGPADTLWRLTRIELFDLTGPVAIGADVSGRLSDPIIRGSLRTEDARIESSVTGTAVTDIKAAGRFNGSRLVIDRFAGGDGRGGTLTGRGSFDLAAVRGFGIDLTVDATRARLIDRDEIAATATGTITFRSDGSGGVIGGDVRLDSARYRLGRAALATPLPRLNVREINLPFGEDVERTPVRPWQFDLRARAASGVTVNGLGLDSEWSADVRIQGQPTNPAITGRADLIRGDYQFSGRQFELDRGIIQFDGSVPVNPALDISAIANAQGLNAQIRVRGNALKPQIGFTSTPALPEDELLSRLLFGTSITNLSAPEAVQLAAAVAALQSDNAGLDPINAVRRATGLDRLRILPADPQTGAATSVAAGKYLTRRTYVEIITDGQGYSATRAEFQVTRWLSLLSSISTIGRQSVNVRVSRDY
ncbi:MULTISPECIES: translocation/assembly module TamB domain-containing protein [unclassified Sphingomonas]|uniref:translocation/assembly module TamB domain-containing protein n=2 Tax=Sphingomonas TaxID=13687 RepID=UPI000AB7E7AC